MVISVSSLLVLCLMFLTKKPAIRKACFFIASAITLYVGYVGVRIGGPLFPIQSAVGIMAGIAAIAAVVLTLIGKGKEKKFLTARIMSSAALVIGLFNAFM